MAYDFPNSPTVGQAYSGYVWDGEKWQAQGTTMQSAVRYDLAQGLTANQMSQGRANINVTKRNYIINGGMMISQENGTTAGTTNGYWPVDMFSFAVSHAGAQSIAQVASPTPGGSPNRLRYTVTTADASVGAGDYAFIGHNPEGIRIADLNFGTAAAKTFTVQFGVKAPAGTYCMSFVNAAANRTYVAEYVIAAGEANTDVVKSVTVPGDTTGTWVKDNTVGVYIRWMLMVGSTNQLTAGAWSAGNLMGSPNQFNFMGTVNNTFELFDVSLTEGSVAPPFQLPDYATELTLCQRYFYVLSAFGCTGHPRYQADTLRYCHGTFPVQMRALPSVTGSGIIDYAGGQVAPSGGFNYSTAVWECNHSVGNTTQTYLLQNFKASARL